MMVDNVATTVASVKILKGLEAQRTLSSAFGLKKRPVVLLTRFHIICAGAVVNAGHTLKIEVASPKE
jgi:hypothetical protein